MFAHDTQLQSLQNTPALKHSQYNFKHLVFLQLQQILTCLVTLLSG